MLKPFSVQKQFKFSTVSNLYTKLQCELYFFLFLIRCQFFKYFLHLTEWPARQRMKSLHVLFVLFDIFWIERRFTVNKPAVLQVRNRKQMDFFFFFCQVRYAAGCLSCSIYNVTGSLPASATVYHPEQHTAALPAHLVQVTLKIALAKGL